MMVKVVGAKPREFPQEDGAGGAGEAAAISSLDGPELGPSNSRELDPLLYKPIEDFRTALIWCNHAKGWNGSAWFRHVLAILFPC